MAAAATDGQAAAHDRQDLVRGAAPEAVSLGGGGRDGGDGGDGHHVCLFQVGDGELDVRTKVSKDEPKNSARQPVPALATGGACRLCVR